MKRASIPEKTLSVGLSLLAAVVWTAALLHSQNILFFNPHWEAFDASEFGVTNPGITTLLARQTLAQGKLNPDLLGQRRRLVSRGAYSWKRIQVEAEFDHLSEITLGIVSGQKIQGFRLSANPLLPSRRLVLDFRGNYELTETVPALSNTGNHALSLEREGKGVSVRLDGTEIGRIPDPLPEGKIYLASYRATVIGVEGETAEGHFELPFRREENFLAFFWPHALLFSLVGFFVPLRFPLGLLCLGLLWLSFDYFAYSRRRFALNFSTLEFEKNTRGEFISYEELRLKFFRSWYRALGGKVITPEELRGSAHFPLPSRLYYFTQGVARALGPDDVERLPKTQAVRRVLIIGGSLTGGWGTSSVSEHYPAHIRRKLSFPAELISYSGFNRLFPEYGPDQIPWIIDAFRPDLVLLEVFFKYSNKDVIEEVIKQGKEKKFTTMAFRAPQDLPHSRPPLVPKALAYLQGKPVKYFSFEDQRILPLLREHGIELIETNDYFLRPETYLRADLYVDDIHLTDAGSEELGVLLARAIEKKLKPTP